MLGMFRKLSMLLITISFVDITRASNVTDLCFRVSCSGLKKLVVNHILSTSETMSVTDRFPEAKNTFNTVDADSVVAVRL